MTAPKKDFKILPSILSADFGFLIDEARTVDIPEINYLHVDVMDGHFVPNLTIGPQVVKSLKEHTRFKLDVHLMIDKVAEFVPLFAEAGADNITIHQETVTHLHREIHRIKQYGISAGVTINPATSLENLRWILTDVDLVLIMSVNPGFGGQKFIADSLQKIRQLSRWREEIGANFIIEVDGGIETANAGEVYLAGARYLVAGSHIFHQPDRAVAIRNLIKGIETAKSEHLSRLV